MVGSKKLRHPPFFYNDVLRENEHSLSRTFSSVNVRFLLSQGVVGKKLGG